MIRPSRGRKRTFADLLEPAVVVATAVPALGLAAMIEGTSRVVASPGPTVAVGLGLAAVYLALVLFVPFLLLSLSDFTERGSRPRVSGSPEARSSVPSPHVRRFPSHVQARFHDVARGGEGFREARLS